MLYQSHTRIWASNRISIGNDVLTAHNANIIDNDTHPTDYLERRQDADNIIRKGVREEFKTWRSAAIEIGNDVWIGCNSIILKRVIIGGAIVSAGSVITKNDPPFTVVGGNPARVLKQIKEE